MELFHELQLSSLASAVISKTSELQSQNVANIVWTFGGLAVPNCSLFQALSLRVKHMHGEFDAQNISNIFWELATVMHEDSCALMALSHEAASKLDTFTGQDVSNTA